MQIVMLAGGLATRMRPLSERLPKSLFPVAGRPFLDHQLELLARGGATRVLLCLGYLGEMIRAHVGSHALALPVDFVEDGASPAGTGGALRAACDQGKLEERFVLCYGDSYLPIDLRPLWERHLGSGLPVTMTVLENQGRWDASNCVVEGGRVVRYEKIKDPALRPPQMTWIDYGVQVLERSFVAAWTERPPFDLAPLLTRLSLEGRLGAHAVTQRFYEIGSFEGLAELERLLGAGQPPALGR